MIQEFAAERKLKAARDKSLCDEVTIRGKVGHIYEYSDTLLGVCFIPGRWTPKTWNRVCRECTAAGMILRQNGDTEGCLSFDPSNRTQAKLAIKAVRARSKRQLSPEQVARQVANLAEFRSQTKQEGALAF